MNNELISLCLTTYNRSSTLHLTIESILSQTYSDFELIISDDNSSDATKEVCESYAAKDGRIRYYRNSSNLKMPGNLNAAISHASGKFIANLHDGDIYRKDLIEKWFNLLKKHPDALFVFNQYTELDRDDKLLRVHDHKLSEVNTGNVLIEYYLKTLTSAPWGTVMARKEAYDNYGVFKTEYGFISDVEMWLRLGLYGKVCYVNEPLIDLTPREKNHPFFLPHWRIFCLQNIILLKYYKLYSQKYPELTEAYPSASLLKRIEYSAIRNMIILIKYRSFNRVKEGINLFLQLPLSRLKKIGTFLSLLKLTNVPYESDIKNLKSLLESF